MNDKLWLVWKEPIERRRFVIGELIYDGFQYIFQYNSLELDEARSKGFDYFPGFPDLEKLYESFELFASIDTRLPNRMRPDYLDILNSYNLTIQSSKMDVLRKTKGRLLTDNFEFVPVFNKNKVEFEIAGTRHYLLDDTLKSCLKVNDCLILKKDDTNSKDSYAVLVLYQNKDSFHILGYVPRYYSKQIFELLSDDIKYSIKIENLNLNTPLSGEEFMVGVKLIFDKMDDVEAIKCDLKNFLSPFRYGHSIRVAEEAKRLAQHFHIDVNKAYLAGLVHDIAKEFTDIQNKKIIEEYHLPKDFLLKEYQEIIHADLGAIFVREKYHLDEDICQAVRYHVIGNVNMNTLDKVIYLADKIGRRVLPPALEEVKRLVYHEGLDDALLFCINNQKEKLSSEGVGMHLNTLELLQDLEDKVSGKSHRKINKD